jgi:RNA polymerase sigma-70 factor (ECF subfamily)
MMTPEHNKPRQTFETELEALYMETREMVLQAAFRTIGNKEDAEDALQTIFTRLVERPEIQKEFRKNPKGYLYRAAIHEALRIIRTRERQRLVDTDIDSLDIEFPDLDANVKEDIRRVREAMAKMKPDRSEILYLHYYNGLSCQEIAKMQHRPLATVLCKLFRARTELKKWILIQEKEHETQKENDQRNGLDSCPQNSEARGGRDRGPGLAAAQGHNG